MEITDAEEPPSGEPVDARAAFHQKLRAGMRKASMENWGRDSITQTANRRIGASVCADLERRFPQLLRR